MHIYGKIFKDSKTIEEVKSFAKAYNIKDDKELKDWFNIRTLLNEKQFKEVLKQFKMSREEFSTALMYSDLIKIVNLQKPGKNYLLKFQKISKIIQMTQAILNIVQLILLLDMQKEN